MRVEETVNEKNKFIILEDKLDKYPNIKNFWSASEWEKIRKDDGHIYYIPKFVNGKDDKYTATNFGVEAFWIQKAVLEWVNYNMCAYGYFPGY